MPNLAGSKSRLIIRLFCNDCKQMVDMEREKLVTDLLSVDLEGCPSTHRRVVTFRCDECGVINLREDKDSYLIVPGVMN